ncbi:AbrB/MazE/SpoVT family DNA-binding domain-containing protein [Paraburkholderia sp. HP33-1]|uniref:AbrB/MazE/SpoVT family DNA-binding domain-containing protein n=1 Tax=Paraburkholderia sp. HP33-1 TaxID=2883243 RepID=UPI001F17309E|nr:AbrB/MazE/SpoVT family DNA-binding domain-containing protein [Paraburkholderia sp. HP33-1]
MTSATVGSKGRITIPAPVRIRLGLLAGDRIAFLLSEETGRYEVVPVTCPVAGLRGIVCKPARPVSIEDMNAAIAGQGAWGERRRSLIRARAASVPRRKARP